MAKRRKIVQAAPLWLSASDLHGLDDLRAAVRNCATGDGAIVASVYDRIGDILQANVTRLGLDERTHQLCVLANRIGCEVLSDEEREFHYPGGCWVASRYDSCPPFQKKVDGKHSSSEEVRSPEKRKVLMTEIFVQIVSNDPAFRQAAAALKAHAEANGLFPEEDWLSEGS